jgi:hypothetical protein
MPSHKNTRVTGYLLLNFLESLADFVYTLYGFGHLLEDSKGLRRKTKWSWWQA